MAVFLKVGLKTVLFLEPLKLEKGQLSKTVSLCRSAKSEMNCVIDSAILDKDVRIESGTVMIGSNTLPLVVPKGTVQGELMNS